MGLVGMYECVFEMWMGWKNGMFVVVFLVDGESFMGVLSNSMFGLFDIIDGMIDGDMLICQFSVISLMCMKVDCEVIIDGDNLLGFVMVGMFGEMKFLGSCIV